VEFANVFTVVGQFIETALAIVPKTSLSFGGERTLTRELAPSIGIDRIWGIVFIVGEFFVSSTT
jgi:hypothetical protein